MFEKIVIAFAITCCTVISDAVLAQEPLNLVETQIYGTQTSVTPTTTTTTTTVSVWKVPLRKTVEEEPKKVTTTRQKVIPQLDKYFRKLKSRINRLDRVIGAIKSQDTIEV